MHVRWKYWRASRKRERERRGDKSWISITSAEKKERGCRVRRSRVKKGRRRRDWEKEREGERSHWAERAHLPSVVRIVLHAALVRALQPRLAPRWKGWIRGGIEGKRTKKARVGERKGESTPFLPDLYRVISSSYRPTTCRPINPNQPFHRGIRSDLWWN